MGPQNSPSDQTETGWHVDPQKVIQKCMIFIAGIHSGKDGVQEKGTYTWFKPACRIGWLMPYLSPWTFTSADKISSALDSRAMKHLVDERKAGTM